MKQIVILSLLFLQAVFVSAQVDTLLTVKKSRIDYCNAKIEQVKLQKNQILTKDSIIVLQNTKIQNKEEEILSLKREEVAYNNQLAINATTSQLKEIELKNNKTEIKQLKKKVGILKLTVGGLILLTVYSWVHP